MATYDELLTALRDETAKHLKARPKTITVNGTSAAPDATGKIDLGTITAAPAVRNAKSKGGAGAMLHMSTPDTTDAPDAPFVILHRNQYAKVQQIKAVSPNTRCFFYANGIAPSDQAGSGSWQPSVITYPQYQANTAWQLKTSGGVTVGWTDYTYLHPTDVGRSDLIAQAVANVTAWFQAEPLWDGVFVDDVLALDPALNEGHTWTGVPVFQAGSLFNAYDAFVKGFGPQIKALGKGVVWNMQVKDTSWAPQVDGWSPYGTHTFIEFNGVWPVWNSDGTHSTVARSDSSFIGGSGAQWRVQVGQRIQAAGAGFIAHDYIATDDLRSQAYHRAIFGMAWDGKSDSYSLITPAPYTATWKQPGARFDLGAPVGVMDQPSSSVMRRTFEDGSVYVNITANSIVVPSANGPLPIGPYGVVRTTFKVAATTSVGSTATTFLTNPLDSTTGWDQSGVTVTAGPPSTFTSTSGYAQYGITSGFSPGDRIRITMTATAAGASGQWAPAISAIDNSAGWVGLTITDPPTATLTGTNSYEFTVPASCTVLYVGYSWKAGTCVFDTLTADRVVTGTTTSAGSNGSAVSDTAKVTGQKIGDTVFDTTAGALKVWNGSAWVLTTAGYTAPAQPRAITLYVNSPATAATWASMPSAVTELLGRTTARTKIDLTGYTQARIVVAMGATAGATNAGLALQYSTDLATWKYLDEATLTMGTTGPSVGIATTSSVASGWVNLAAGAKADVWIRVVGSGGQGSTSPIIGNVTANFR